MKKVLGSFVFRNEGDGCLTSKYLEHTSNRLYTECCKIQTTPKANLARAESSRNLELLHNYTKSWGYL